MNSRILRASLVLDAVKIKFLYYLHIEFSTLVKIKLSRMLITTALVKFDTYEIILLYSNQYDKRLQFLDSDCI